MNLEKTEQRLKLDEGFRSQPYLDTKGKVTIGYGDNLSAKGITMDDAIKIYPNGISIQKAEDDLKDKVFSIEILNSKAYREEHLRERYTRLSEMMRTGEWPS